MEGDEKQSWQEGLMETFDGVEVEEEERNVKESGPDRIDDAFQPHNLIPHGEMQSPRGQSLILGKLLGIVHHPRHL